MGEGGGVGGERGDDEGVVWCGVERGNGVADGVVLEGGEGSEDGEQAGDDGAGDAAVLEGEVGYARGPRGRGESVRTGFVVVDDGQAGEFEAPHAGELEDGQQVRDVDPRDAKTDRLQPLEFPRPSGANPIRPVRSVILPHERVDDLDLLHVRRRPHAHGHLPLRLQQRGEALPALGLGRQRVEPSPYPAELRLPLENPHGVVVFAGAAFPDDLLHQPA